MLPRLDNRENVFTHFTQENGISWLSCKKSTHSCSAFGDPLKFATNTILNAALPGGAAVVQMVDNVIDWAIKTARGIRPGKVKPPAASADDLQRMEEILDVLGGDLQALPR